MNKAAALLRLTRPRQWTKNLLVFAALLFAGQTGNAAAWQAAGLAFVAFICASASVYAINDVKDRHADAEHEKKRHRPVASGLVAPGMALVLAAILVVGALALGFSINTPTLAAVACYLLLQFAYVYKLKTVALLDVFVVASGFVIRAIAGGMAISAPVSGWLLFCTGALALMLGTAKRRQEFRSEKGHLTRAVLKGYSEKALDSLVVFSATLAALAYGIYALESPTGRQHPMLMATTPFVLFGIGRYLLLVFGQEVGEEPEEVLLRDPAIILTVVGFVVCAAWALSTGVTPGSPSGLSVGP